MRGAPTRPVRPPMVQNGKQRRKGRSRKIEENCQGKDLLRASPKKKDRRPAVVLTAGSLTTEPSNPLKKRSKEKETG